MQDKVWDDFSTLPLEAQRQAADFIAFLRQRYRKPTVGTEAKKTDLSAEPFIGMWQDREEMQDSTVWVRDLRKRTVSAEQALKWMEDFPQRKENFVAAVRDGKNSSIDIGDLRP